MSERRYNEDEVALILRKAVEARGDDGTSVAGKGLTLYELKEIGAEVGIDAERIQAAAAELDRPDVGAVGRVLGVPSTVQLERVVPVRVAREQLPRLLDLIRQQLGRQGIVEEVLGGFEWRARSAMGGRYVSIRPEGDQTRIRVLGNYRDGMLATTLSGVPIGAAVTGVLGGVLGAATPFLVVPAMLVGAAAAAVGPYRFLFRREARSLVGVLDALERGLLDSVPDAEG